MTTHQARDRQWTRRQFGQAALTAVPGVGALGGMLPSWTSPVEATAELGATSAVDSRIKGVQIGIITYSFRAISDAETIVKTMAAMGLGTVELMSNHAEALAGAPHARDAEALRAWRAKTSPATGRPVRKRFDDAGLTLWPLCYNMNAKTFSDDDIEYGFSMTTGLGLSLMSTSTQVSMAKRVAPFADRHNVTVAYHGHANVTNPDEVATPESFATCLSYSRFHAINLDIGHFTAAGFDAVGFLQQHHARVTHLHLKDRQTAGHGGANLPWGQGDTPIRQVLQLLSREKWDMPAHIEFEYPGDPLVEVPRCFEFCKDALA